MTKGVRTTLVLFIVLGALAAFAVYTNNADKVAATPTASAYVWDLTTANVASLQIIDNTRQREVTLSRDASGAWQVESSKVTSGAVLVPIQPADPGQGDYGASLVSTMILQRTLTETTQLGEYGLMSPAYVLNITQTDGTAKSLRVGQKTPTGDGYYVIQSGQANPAIVLSTAIDPLIGYLDNPPLPPSPTPAETATPAETTTPESGTPGAATATPTP
jgi:hypothetical protein